MELFFYYVYRKTKFVDLVIHTFDSFGNEKYLIKNKKQIGWLNIYKQVEIIEIWRKIKHLCYERSDSFSKWELIYNSIFYSTELK